MTGKNWLLPMVVLIAILSCLAGCGDKDPDNNYSGPARWTFLVWMNGDNNLEGYITHDLNELEAVGSGDNVNVVVQADRIPGFADDDGDWTETRRYYIVHDDDPTRVTSPIVANLGEVDMGDPAAVSDFLLWAHATYPAEHYAVVFWDHGDGWSKNRVGEQLNAGVSWDDTSGNFLSIANGGLRAALTPLVSARGPIEVVGFDACNMSAWEVAHSLRDQVLTMTASEAWVGGEGYLYGSALSLLRTNPRTTAADLAREMARASVVDGGELTHAAIDLSAMDELAAAIDDLAGEVLDDPTLQSTILAARDQARGADEDWKNWYLDLKDFARVLAGNTTSVPLASTGNLILTAIDRAVLNSYGNAPYEWVGGLSLFFDLDWPDYLSLYHSGIGATWASATRWDDLLLVLAANRLSDVGRVGPVRPVGRVGLSKFSECSD